MIRHLGRLWVVAFGFALAMASMALAQDMTGGMVTDPPAPVADGYATFTGTYTNLGSGTAESPRIQYYFGIEPQVTGRTSRS